MKISTIVAGILRYIVLCFPSHAIPYNYFVVYLTQVRQFLFGQRFFKEQLGVTPDIFWLPDTFGVCRKSSQNTSTAQSNKCFLKSAGCICKLSLLSQQTCSTFFPFSNLNRVLAAAAADHGQSRLPLLRHAETLLEPDKHLPALDLLLGGPGRHPRPHPLPAGW